MGLLSLQKIYTMDRIVDAPSTQCLSESMSDSEENKGCQIAAKTVSMSR